MGALGALTRLRSTTKPRRHPGGAFRFTAVTARAEAAETTLALADRYGADQWRRGNAGKDPQEFAEWQKEAQP